MSFLALFMYYFGVPVHSVHSNCINPFKIAFGDGIYALLHHFHTVCAVNAQTCVDSNILVSLPLEKLYFSRNPYGKGI